MRVDLPPSYGDVRPASPAPSYKSDMGVPASPAPSYRSVAPATKEEEAGKSSPYLIKINLTLASLRGESGSGAGARRGGEEEGKCRLDTGALSLATPI